MAGRVRTRRRTRVLALALGLALGVAGCGSGSPATNATSECGHWCGSGSARITAGGVTATISGGGCYDTGAAGIDARFGDWVEGGVGDYVTISGYRVGGPTPTPAPSSNIALPTAIVHLNIAVGASVAGQIHVLDTDANVTFAADGTGSFSGTDLNGAGLVSGTFSCK